MTAEPMAFLNLAVIGVTLYLTWRGFEDPSFSDRLLFSTDEILRHRQYYRVLTSGFIHADWPHVLFNLFSLYSFGRYIELLFGPVTFALIYFSGIIGGSLLALLLHRNESYRSLGASGGVCGVIFASIFLLPGGSISIFPVPIAIPSYLYAILFIVASAIGSRGRIGNVGHDAHLGGALIGLGTATAMYPYIVRESPVLYAVVVALSAGLLLWLYWRTETVSFGAVARRGLFQRDPSSEADTKARQRQADDRTMDQLLEKISRNGMEALTDREKSQLADLSRKKRGPGR